MCLSDFPLPNLKTKRSTIEWRSVPRNEIDRVLNTVRDIAVWTKKVYCVRSYISRTNRSRNTYTRSETEASEARRYYFKLFQIQTGICYDFFTHLDDVSVDCDSEYFNIDRHNTDAYNSSDKFIILKCKKNIRDKRGSFNVSLMAENVE